MSPLTEILFFSKMIFINILLLLNNYLNSLKKKTSKTRLECTAMKISFNKTKFEITYLTYLITQLQQYLSTLNKK